MNRGGSGSAVAWMLAIGLALMSLRACEGPVPLPDRGDIPAGEALPHFPAPGAPGDDFAAPPETRVIQLANGLRIDEAQVAHSLRAGGHAETWMAFAWLLNDETVTTVAPGLDRRHHFANAYLVGYVPFEGVEPWVPLVTLAQRKQYAYDHDQYPGMPELWQTSREAFYYPQGDCEDHAIALADWLIGLGLDARVVLGRLREEGHAWVVVLDGARTYLLEATHKRPGRALPLASQLPEYRPEAMFNRESYWVNAGTPLTTDYTGGRWQLRSGFSRE